jgi:hypothetical protein
MGNVYFIRSDDRIKIGYSDDVKQRRTTLQTANGRLLTIEYIIENVDIKFESHTHEVCKNYLIRNEWFREGVLEHLLSNPWYKENMKLNFPK